MIRVSFLASVIGLLIDIAYLTCPPPDPIPNCFGQADFDSAILIAKSQLEFMENLLTINQNYPGFSVTERDPGFMHFSTHNVDPNAFEDNRVATYVNSALTILKTQKNLTKSQMKICTANLRTNAFCVPKVADCDPNATRYYRLDGQCNNVRNPLWGAKSSPMIRLLPDNFDDGIESLSRADSPRTNSLTANDIKGLNDQTSPGINSDMSTMIGTILTHELMKTKKTQLTSRKQKGGFNCCNPRNDPQLATLINANRYCMPINIANNDPCYGINVKCLNYIKSFKGLDNCRLDSTPMPTNFHTAFFDGKLIYNDRSLPHLVSNGGKFNADNFEKMKDILVGFDDRTNMLPGFFLYLMIFVRFHNVVFDELLRFSRSPANLQDISFEARRITTAAYQKSFLDYALSFITEDQIPVLQSFDNCYDPNLNPQVSLEFNIVLRLFHYFIRETHGTYDENLFRNQNGLRGRRPSSFPLLDAIDDLSWYQSNRCGITHGLSDIGWNIAGVGKSVNCNFLQPNKTSPGTDLRSADFQLGYENGEPSYIEVLRRFNGLNKCDRDVTINDFVNHGGDARNLLSRRFRNRLWEIGFSLGADLEDHKGQIIGPTTSLVIVEQLKRSICGDRFWFSNNPFFREDQKNRIRNLNLNSIACLVNNCNGTRFASNFFLSPSSDNLKIPCSSPSQILADLDLRNW